VRDVDLSEYGLAEHALLPVVCERGKAQKTALAIGRREQQRLVNREEKEVVYCCSK
jgi:hypothetical protein